MLAAGGNESGFLFAFQRPVKERRTRLREAATCAPGLLVRLGQELGPAEQRLFRFRSGYGLFGGRREVMPYAGHERCAMILSARRECDDWSRFRLRLLPIGVDQELVRLGRNRLRLPQDVLGRSGTGVQYVATFLDPLPGPGAALLRFDPAGPEDIGGRSIICRSLG